MILRPSPVPGPLRPPFWRDALLVVLPVVVSEVLGAVREAVRRRQTLACAQCGESIGPGPFVCAGCCNVEKIGGAEKPEEAEKP